MGAEDQVLTDMLIKINPDFRIFTLDTGRLFPETLNLIQQTRKHYHANLEVFFPITKQVQEMVKEKGINLFYDSVENRKLCCHIRKMEPLKRALTRNEGLDNRNQERSDPEPFQYTAVEWDETNGLVKINPLYRWTEKMVWEYIQDHHIPYNELHDKGFPSIGCQPCTRAIIRVRIQGRQVVVGRSGTQRMRPAYERITLTGLFSIKKL